MRVGTVDPLLVPAPTEVLQALLDDRSLLAHDLLIDRHEVVLGLALALVAGAAFGVRDAPVDAGARACCARWWSARRPCRSR